MALKIRLQKRGRAHRPIYKVVVAESSARRDGRFVEQLGNYNPSPMGAEVRLTVDLLRVDYWLGVGAQPTDTVRNLIRDARKGSTAAAA
ncbi:MAG: 30S ribosomal protein S16 [Puniceicoccales bacterium]|jgi:small subunit ribosomal protein S16|nr:30S ribosomal protein S16 [Puniceicoccales bacterium]